ncbi:tumor necrosis factor receptor superfamily member 16-like, partial [Clarias magur]
MMDREPIYRPVRARACLSFKSYTLKYHDVRHEPVGVRGLPRASLTVYLSKHDIQKYELKIFRIDGQSQLEIEIKQEIEIFRNEGEYCGAHDVGVFSAQEACPSGQKTTSGECCRQCPPGEGVVKPCGETQTECQPCQDSETFSENFSHTEQCTACTDCTGLLRMETPCTDANDATCVCDYGYFMSRFSGRCELCTACPVGSGVLRRCSAFDDTSCETCTEDTYSDQESELNLCLPCTICEDTEELQHCTPVSDTVCQVDLNIVNTSSTPLPALEDTEPPFDVNLPPEAPPEPTDILEIREPTVGPEPTKLGLGDNLIPLYASIVPAVLLGLVAFIVIKRWKSCKPNKQEGSNRSGTENPSQTPSPEGEKLHSDSGISVDSQSLQEGQGLSHT